VTKEKKYANIRPPNFKFNTTILLKKAGSGSGTASPEVTDPGGSESGTLVVRKGNLDKSKIM
jgi:hypothetical protein